MLVCHCGVESGANAYEPRKVNEGALRNVGIQLMVGFLVCFTSQHQAWRISCDSTRVHLYFAQLAHFMSRPPRPISRHTMCLILRNDAAVRLLTALTQCQFIYSEPCLGGAAVASLPSGVLSACGISGPKWRPTDLGIPMRGHSWQGFHVKPEANCFGLL